MKRDNYGGHPARDHTGRPLGHNEYTELALHTARILAQLPALHAELEARMTAERDSLPKTSLGGGSRPSSDHDGEPLPDYSDPVGQAATTTPEDDTDGRALIDALTTTRELNRIARSLHGRLERQLRPPTKYTDGPTADRGCRSCARTKVEHPDGKHRARYTPAGDDGLCEFCTSYQTAQGILPGTETLRNWHRSGKCTDRDIARDLRDEERRLNRGNTQTPTACATKPAHVARPGAGEDPLPSVENPQG